MIIRKVVDQQFSRRKANSHSTSGKPIQKTIVRFIRVFSIRLDWGERERERKESSRDSQSDNRTD